MDYDGPTATVQFRADGTFERATAGEVRSEGTYEVEGESIYVTAEYGRSWLGAFGVDRDDLIVDDRARDGAAEYYRRVE